MKKALRSTKIFAGIQVIGWTVVVVFMAWLFSGCSIPITQVYPQPEKGPNVYLISYSGDGDKKWLEKKIDEIATKICPDYVFMEEVSYGIDKERLATDFVGRIEWLIGCPSPK